MDRERVERLKADIAELQECIQVLIQEHEEQTAGLRLAVAWLQKREAEAKRLFEMLLVGTSSHYYGQDVEEWLGR